MARKRLGEMLIEAGVIDAAQLESALGEQRRWGGQLGKILVDKQFTSEASLVKVLARQLSLPVVDLRGIAIAEELTELVPEELARDHLLVPFRKQGSFLDVAMSDPMNMGILDELRIRTQLNVRPFLAPRTAISESIQRAYGGPAVFGIEIPPSPRHDRDADLREAEIAALQQRLANLEALVSRDENVIRKLLGLLVQKGVATREEILEAIK